MSPSARGFCLKNLSLFVFLLSVTICLSPANGNQLGQSSRFLSILDQAKKNLDRKTGLLSGQVLAGYYDHPNISQGETDHPNAPDWINPRETDGKHPNATWWIMPRNASRELNDSDWVESSDSRISRGDGEEPSLTREHLISVECGSHPIAPGSIFQIHTKNYPSSYPKGYRGCTWRFKGTTNDMELELNCPVFQLPLCRKGSKRARKKCQRTNFLLMKDQNGKVLKRYRGTTGPKDVVIEGNSLTLVFRTRTPSQGFSCTVRAIYTGLELTSEFPSSCNFACGIGPPPPTGGRIVGGIASSPGRWPWVAGLAPRGMSDVICGATLIHPEWALTAAHCAERIISERVEVDLLLGAFDLDRPTSLQQRVQVEYLHVHEGYGNMKLTNDIAVIRLAFAASITDKVSPICLPKEDGTYKGSSFVVPGWGVLQEDGHPSSILQEALVESVPISECEAAYGDLLAPTMMCATGDEKDACEGDSGGGLMWSGPTGKWALAGIVSWGHGCARPGLPGVYTSVNKFLPWITGVTGVSSCGPPESSPGPNPGKPTRTTTTTTTTQSPKACRCGRAYKRIVGGMETGVNEYPWQAALVREGSWTPFCGASIVGRRHVLTAAHCTAGIQQYNWKVEILVGAHSTHSNSNTPQKARIPMESMHQHPHYSKSNLRHDISLIKLAKPLDLDADPRLAPVCLPARGEQYAGANAVVSGWGKLKEGGQQPQLLQKVWVPVITNEECDESYTGAIFAESLCAGYPEGGKDSCQGDSGGPLVTESKSLMVQIGVVSWGTGCARPGKPGVYARVTEYLDWIKSITGSEDTCA